ncbi:MAG: mechanosensitive ion channel family protein [Candidatus Muiribacteriota bacterium]
MDFISKILAWFNVDNYSQAEILKTELFSNTISQYLTALIIFVAGLFFVKIFNIVLFKNIKKLIQKTPMKIDNLIIELTENLILPILYIIPLYVSVIQLNIAEKILNVFNSILIVYIAIQFARVLYAIFEFIITEKWFNREGTQVTKTTFFGIMLFVKFLIGLLCLIFILDNLGFNISTIVAGLGVGGIALALASQNILNDLFNYFVIFFDRPFEVGDFIIVGEFMGVVKYIGVKTTRLTSISGEEIVFSNSDLTGSRVRNYKKMEKRRAAFKLGVIYGTTAEQLRKIPPMIKEIIESMPKTEFNRCHFKEYGDFNLVIEAIFYVDGNDMNEYLNIQQEINLKIKEEFEKEGIEFALPTQSIVFENELAIRK